MKKNIFLIGNPKSSFLTQYIENVLEPLGFEVYMQDVFDDDREDFVSFFRQHKVHIIRMYVANEKLIFSVPFFGSKIRTVSNIIIARQTAKFDVIHVHYVQKFKLIKSMLLKSKNTKLFATFYGSDLLRQSMSYLKSEQKYFDRFGYISASSYKMRNKYDEVCPTAKNKLNIITFGASLFDYIDRWYGDHDSCKDFFGFPKDKKSISVGYNAIREQQHDKVVEVLKNLKNKQEYLLLFQMTYGGHIEPEYIQHMQEVAASSGFEYRFFTDYLSMDDLARLRIATDIFINAQTTDAFCNSIKEYMYAKTQILSARWLHYPEIDLFPLHVSEFSAFSEIPSLLEKPLGEEKLEWNRNKIKQESSWDTCRNKWAEAYGIDILQQAEASR